MCRGVAGRGVVGGVRGEARGAAAVRVDFEGLIFEHRYTEAQRVFYSSLCLRVGGRK